MKKKNNGTDIIDKYIHAHAGMWAGRIIEIRKKESDPMACIIDILKEFAQFQDEQNER